MLTIFLITLLISIVVCEYFLLKNDNTQRQQCKIVDAIYAYSIDCIYKDKEKLVTYRDMESYNKTLFRFWDWGCENILPKEKYEIIEPYIKH